MQIISVIIPCFNNNDTIIDAVESVLRQSYKNTEIIVVDDCSKNPVSEIINNYINTCPTFKVITLEKNMGQSFARNEGAKNSKGEFLVFLDADDKLHEQYIEKCINAYHTNPKLNIVYSELTFFGRWITKWEIKEYNPASYLKQETIPIYAMIRSAAFRAVGMFDENLRYNEDWDLWIRIIDTYGGYVYRIPEVLYFYRKRNDSSSITDIPDEQLRERSLLYLYYKNYYYFKKNGATFEKIFLGTEIQNYRDKLLRMKRKYYNIWYKKIFYKIKGEMPWENID